MTRDALPSWNHTPARQAILDFVAAAADAAGPRLVPPAERVAVFDNDGTLWCEKPMYVQLDHLLRNYQGDDADVRLVLGGILALGG